MMNAGPDAEPARGLRAYGTAAARSVLLVSVILSACSSGKRSEHRAKGARREAPVPVVVATAVSRDVPVEVRAIGTVEAYQTVAVKPRVSGELARTACREGQEVEAGDLLFVVDPRPREIALRQAKANLARDLAQARNAELEARRVAELRAQGVVSRDEYDRVRTRAAALRATVKADRAAVERAKLELQYCYVHAPIAGRLGRVLVHRGNIVKADETTLVVIKRLRPVYVRFTVPERRIAEIRRYMTAGPLTVEAELGADSTRRLVGKLTFVDNAADPTTGTVLLKARFANEDERLWPGQFVDVSLTLATRRAAVTIPARAVQTGQQGRYVFVVRQDATVESRPVKVELSTGSDVVVSGVRPGEQVVTDGQVRLAPGVAVTVRKGQGA